MTFFRSSKECLEIIDSLKPLPAARFFIKDNNSPDDSENHKGLAFEVVKLNKDGKPKAVPQKEQDCDNRYSAFVEYAKKNHSHGNWFLFAKEVKNLFPKNDHKPLFKRVLVDLRFQHVKEPFGGSSRYKVRLRQESDKCL
jgi:hypothetical protein